MSTDAGKTELGKIERPEAEQFKEQRKLYLVPLVYSPSNPPTDYLSILARYWTGAREHIRRLEDRIGKVNRVYHESVPVAGDEGLKIVAELSEKSHEIVAEKIEVGATLEALEDADVLAEAIDWQRCLMLGLTSQKASSLIWSNYRDSAKRRSEIMAKRIDDTLGEGEAGLLFVIEEHSIQFPPSLQVFYVAPPALDEIHRWMRDQGRTAQGES